ncbi:hypothetical protein PTT_06250 [Pyrenophora teres f. teres 0-1]|uniref:Uncharacterized protein n=1 Tax=Pyrenophora teres f. teres (strain 0-1) TaxID=861557 RepID=E3RFG5_PYRTT|nr:hypothetical protein PTT_06250 [Pyrenophora teres f. teres 0-1]
MDPGANDTEKGLMLTKQKEDSAKAKQAVASAMAKAKETVLVTKEALATIQQFFLTFYIPKYFLKTVNMDNMDDFDIYVFFWGPETSVDYQRCGGSKELLRNAHVWRLRGSAKSLHLLPFFLSQRYRAHEDACGNMYYYHVYMSVGRRLRISGDLERVWNLGARTFISPFFTLSLLLFLLFSSIPHVA